MGMLEFFVMIVGFTGGASVVAMVVARAIRVAREGGTAGSGRAFQELQDEVEQLRAEVDRLRGEVERAGRPPELDDIQNRLDFAERMLAQVKAQALPGGR